MVGKGKDGDGDGGEGHGHVKPREESTFVGEEDLRRRRRREGGEGCEYCVEQLHLKRMF